MAKSKKPLRNNGAAKKKTVKQKPIENVSKRYPNGRTLKTQDRYLPTSKKGGSDNPKAQRRVAIVDSNRYDELAVVRLTTQQQANTSLLKDYEQGNGKKTHFKHFVEIMDNEGNPIKVDGEKFIENPWAYDLTPEQVEYIRRGVLLGKRQSKENNKKIAALKLSGGKKGKKKR